VRFTLLFLKNLLPMDLNSSSQSKTAMLQPDSEVGEFDNKSHELIDDPVISSGTIEHKRHRSMSQISQASQIHLYDSYAGETGDLTSPSRHLTGSMKASVSMLKSYIGSGILFLPRAFEHGGYLVAPALLIFFCLLSGYTSLALIKSREHMGKIPYGRLMEEALGHRMGRHMVDASVVLLQFGVVVSYVILISAQMQMLIKVVFDVTWHPWKIILIEFFMITPLCWIRQIGKLAIPNVIADILVGCCLLVVLALVYDHLGHIDHIKMAPYRGFRDTMICIGTLCFSFEGICLLIPINDSLKNSKKFPKVFFSVYTFLFMNYMFVGIGGALSYSNRPQDGVYGTNAIILMNLNTLHPNVARVIQVCYAIVLLFTAPLMCLPAYRIVELPVFGPPVSKPPLRNRIMKSLYRSLIMAIICLIGVIGYDFVDNVVSLVGCFSGCPLVFIYPCIAHHVLTDSMREKLIDKIIIVLGVLIMSFVTVVNISIIAGA